MHKKNDLRLSVLVALSLMLVLAVGLSGKTQAQTTTTSPEPAASNTPSWLQQQKEMEQAEIDAKSPPGDPYR